MREKVGVVLPMTGGARARCVICNWEHDFSTVEKATQTIRGHILRLHPAPIFIYRDEESS